MTLDEAARHFGWSLVHDYSRKEVSGGRIVAIRGLGIWEADLEELKRIVQGLNVVENHRVKHDHDDWLRADIEEANR